jgi:ABC-type oligopeptide transport system substrate-binding subunit
MVKDELEIKDINKSNKKIYDTVDYVVADMVVKKWNQVASQLGFKFEIKCVNTAQYNETTSSLVQYRDYFIEALYGTLQGSWKDEGLGYTDDNKKNVYVKTERANFDIIALDSSMIDTTAFSVLSVFAAEYSGAMSDDDFKTLGHITGYNKEEYNKLIAEAYQAKVDGNIQLMSEKLHEAEAMLLKDMPVVPLFVYKNAVLKSRKLRGVKYSEWGYPIFDKANLPKWEKYLPKTDEEED